MKKALTTLGALACALSLTTAAAAQGATAPDVSYEFEDDNVEGGYRSPLGDIIRVPPRGSRVSLVRPRVHFVPELVKSIETI
ncbi:MAG: hypothetical protein KF729_25260 [Sandaracinaceae bacterium]|nr:hypothetical protein [Sandaracinaceae bacterium]